MPVNPSITAARAGTNVLLTTIAQGFRPKKKRVMHHMFPIVETATYGGTVLSFDDSAYDEAVDDRADDSDYPEVQFGYDGVPYKLNTKGLQVRIGNKRKREMGNLRINWGRVATNFLMDKASLLHEIEAATLATTVGNYATANRTTLTAGSQFNDNIDPMPVILTAKTVVSDNADEDANLCIMGEETYNGLITNPYIKEHALHNVAIGDRARRLGINPDDMSPAQISTQMLAVLFGVERVEVCKAKRKVGGVKTKVFGKHMVFSYTNPAGLDGSRLPYRANGDITSVEPAMGYTFVMEGNPLMYTPHRDEDRKADVFLLDFDRKVTPIGVDGSGKIIYGYLIANAVA